MALMTDDRFNRMAMLTDDPLESGLGRSHRPHGSRIQFNSVREPCSRWDRLCGRWDCPCGRWDCPCGRWDCPKQTPSSTFRSPRRGHVDAVQDLAAHLLCSVSASPRLTAVYTSTSGIIDFHTPLGGGVGGGGGVWWVALSCRLSFVVPPHPRAALPPTFPPSRSLMLHDAGTAVGISLSPPPPPPHTHTPPQGRL